MLKINGHEIDVDYRVELERFTWDRATWSDTKLIASSPFRLDRSPSFFVSLEHGGWRDSGAVDSEWSSGSFVRLLSFLRNESWEETQDYLLTMYDDSYDTHISLDMSRLCTGLKTYKQKLPNNAILDSYKFRHPYLGKRGISEEVQRIMRIGYCRTSKSVTIPWFTPDGRLATIKHRRVDSKVFWYMKGGLPVRQCVYGIDVIYRRKIRKAVLCESEIDAMYIMSTCPDIGAIAVGGSSLSDHQAGMIARSPIEHLLIATDNDEAGEKLRNTIIGKLSGSVELYNVRFPNQYKDVNELPKESVYSYIFEASRVMSKIVVCNLW